MISNCRIYIARFDQDFSMKKYGFNKTLGISPWTFGCFQCWFNIVYCKMIRHLNSIYMNTVIWFSPSYCISDIPSWMKWLLLQHPTSKCWLDSFRIPCCSFLSPVDGETWWSKFHFDLECSKSEDAHLGGGIYPICIPQSMWVKTYNHRRSHNDIPITCTLYPVSPQQIQ